MAIYRLFLTEKPRFSYLGTLFYVALLCVVPPDEAALSALLDSVFSFTSTEWSRLLETVESRDEKLAAAGEIHRFNRDVAESLSRIQEKYVAIPEDLGRDLNAVMGLIRRHESFETDLVALEAQLQVSTS